MMRSFIICTLHQILLGEQTKKDKMGGTGITHGNIRNAYHILA